MKNSSATEATRPVTYQISRPGTVYSVADRTEPRRSDEKIKILCSGCHLLSLVSPLHQEQNPDDQVRIQLQNLQLENTQKGRKWCCKEPRRTSKPESQANVEHIPKGRCCRRSRTGQFYHRTRRLVEQRTSCTENLIELSIWWNIGQHRMQRWHVRGWSWVRFCVFVFVGQCVCVSI